MMRRCQACAHGSRPTAPQVRPREHRIWLGVIVTVATSDSTARTADPIDTLLLEHVTGRVRRVPSRAFLIESERAAAPVRDHICPVDAFPCPSVDAPGRPLLTAPVRCACPVPRDAVVAKGASNASGARGRPDRHDLAGGK